jgi:carboxypeptidase C (cathepsin A)
LHGQWGDFFDRETAPYYKKIVKSGVRVLLYYGDTDVICQFLSGQKFADTLGLKVLLIVYNMLSKFLETFHKIILGSRSKDSWFQNRI